ncbi:hypothetical protein BZA05DRAFT_397855 [Tricharina praecox]|uniref:uncharacterized protein n=1 Tax=Tricharina praecox TaxID=43433 RepID=UPI00221F1071|nr:uncharacterized protein BZA05DRAFT_397855 [Tricharina praecox]KAI5851801.1 hypothetical protein BZA05DRAFT_397855 [Tricharina praecox]
MSLLANVNLSPYPTHPPPSPPSPAPASPSSSPPSPACPAAHLSLNLAEDPNARYRGGSPWSPPHQEAVVKMSPVVECMGSVAQIQEGYKDGRLDQSVAADEYQQSVEREYPIRYSKRPRHTHLLHTTATTTTTTQGNRGLFYSSATEPGTLIPTPAAAPHHRQLHRRQQHQHIHIRYQQQQQQSISNSSRNGTKHFPLPLLASVPSSTRSTTTTTPNPTTPSRIPPSPPIDYYLESSSTAITTKPKATPFHRDPLAITVQKRVHRRQSRDLSSVRRSLVNELRPFKSMEDCHHRASQHRLLSESSLTPGELEEIIREAGTTQNNDLSHMIVTTATSNTPRYCGSNGAGAHHHNHQHQHHDNGNNDNNNPHHYMNDGLSADGLHTQYAFNTGIASRSHSMSSSLHSNTIHETSTEANTAEQYAVRRSSDPTEAVFVQQSRHSSFSHPVDEYDHHRAAAWAQAFPPEHGIAEVAPALSTTDTVAAEAVVAAHWWGAATAAATAEEEHKARVEASAEEWARHEQASSTHVLASQYSATPHTPAASSFGRGDSAEPYIKTRQSSIVYAHQPPSPGEEYVRTVQHLKSSPAAPSPPESPGFRFDFGYNQQPWLTYPQFHQRQSSIPPTPPSRPPSTSNANNYNHNDTAVVAAATAALAATKTSKSKARASRPPSARKTSSSSIRTSLKQPQLPPTDVSGERSFVNFTPNDASRILSGVAPSGSSKTKARREREAMEKRRKLSEVATTAILAVGGDTSVLAKVDLL